MLRTTYRCNSFQRVARLHTSMSVYLSGWLPCSSPPFLFLPYLPSTLVFPSQKSLSVSPSQHTYPTMLKRRPPHLGPPLPPLHPITFIHTYVQLSSISLPSFYLYHSPPCLPYDRPSFPPTLPSPIPSLHILTFIYTYIIFLCSCYYLPTSDPRCTFI